ncbi:MAG: hypothetical protein NVSMB70_10510 [Chamaesiphon sp.]
MEIVQFYETAVADRSRGYAVQFLTVPRRTYPEISEAFIREHLGFDNFLEIPVLSALPYAIALLLHEQNTEAVLNTFQYGPRLDYPPDLIEFTEYVAYAKVIPFEASPLGSESLATIAATASPLAIGAFLGFTAVGAGPLLFLAVPAGIIICYVAQGVGEGVRERVQDFLKIPRRQDSASQRGTDTPT